MTRVDQNVARRSIGWALAQSWGGRLVLFLMFLLLARVLSPTELGIATACTLVVFLITQISEFGYGDAIVQSPELAPQEVNAPFFMSTFLAVLFSVIVASLAPTAERLLAVPNLAKYLQVACFTAPLVTVLAFQEIFYKRSLQFKVLAYRVLLANSVGGICAVVAAILGWGTWSLILHSYVSVCVGIAWLWSKPLWKPRFVFHWRSLRSLSAFALPVLGVRVLDFTGTRIVDYVILSRFGAFELGIYAAGARLYQTLLQLLQSALADVSLSLLSRINADKSRLRETYVRTLVLMSAVASPVFIFFAICAEEICVVLLGDKWAQAGAITSPLLLLGAVQCIQFTNGPYFTALGRPGYALMLNILKAGVTVPLLLTMRADGVATLIFGFVMGQLAVSPLSFGAAMRLLHLHLRDLLPVLKVVSANAAAALAIYFLRGQLLDEGSLLRLLMCAAAFASTYTILLLLLARDELIWCLKSILNKARTRAGAGDGAQ